MSFSRHLAGPFKVDDMRVEVWSDRINGLCLTVLDYRVAKETRREKRNTDLTCSFIIIAFPLPLFFSSSITCNILVSNYRIHRDIVSRSRPIHCDASWYSYCSHEGKTSVTS